MPVDLTIIFTNYVNYVYGSEMLTSIAFLVILTMVGIRFGWGLESYIVVFTPTILIFLNPFVIGLSPMLLMGLGLIVGFGLLAIVRR